MFLVKIETLILIPFVTNVFTSKRAQVVKTQLKICDKLSYCKGYYKDDTNSVYIVSDKDPDGDTDYDCLSDGDDDGPDDIVNYNFPSFYENKTRLICKQ